MKIVKTMLGIITRVVLIAILVAALAVLILYVYGIRPYVIISGSMEPALKTGSVCFVDTKADYDEIRTGDIIAFEAGNGKLVTHRVHSINAEGMETKGDNNDTSDGITTTEKNFRGKTLFAVPGVGYVVRYLQQPAGRVMVVVVFAALLLLDIIDTVFERKEKNQE